MKSTTELSVQCASLLVISPSKLLLCVDVSLACISVYLMCAWCTWKPDEDIRCPGTEVKKNC